MSLFETRALSLSYGSTPALTAIDLTVEVGDRVAVMGPSGSGKSSLLHCLAGVVTPTSGEVWFDGTRLDALSESRRSRARLEKMGMVFQFGDLVPELTLLENVMLPLQVLGVRRRAVRARALTLIDRLGIADVADQRTGAVSGGQSQRAAVARALVHDPAVVLADEPTGSLDSLTAETVLDTLLEVTQESGAALVVVTHDNVVASHLERLVVVRDGRLQAGVPA
jgi:putative ABC transport system ATP-binding protein